MQDAVELTLVSDRVVSDGECALCLTPDTQLSSVVVIQQVTAGTVEFPAFGRSEQAVRRISAAVSTQPV
jgi:hypothetical protein